ncbi:MAG: TusE/DsrC/DsvC family sulfur relay protein [Kofleriaceae bacterium]
MSQDLTPITRQLDAITAQLAYLTERQRRQEELFSELTPVARAAMSSATAKLAELEEQGLFEYAKELTELGRQALRGFSPQDVRELGESIVAILDAVRALTQPALLAMATDAAAAIEDAGDVKPLGIFGMVKATRNDDVQKGMAVMIEVLRRVGHAAGAASTKQRELSDKKDKLAAMLGARRQKILGTERPRLLTNGSPSATAERAAPARSAPKAAPKPAPAAPAPVVIDGVAFGADGHLADPAAWRRDVGVAIAQLQGVELTDEHWHVLETARKDFEATGTSPNLRRLTEVASVTTKDLYRLFPKAPGRTLAKIAGLPKPAGCL